MGFGKEIKRLRATKPGLSAQGMADALGVKVARLRKWEEKDMSPRYEDAVLIEKFFDMKQEEIMKLNDLNKFEFVPRETRTLNEEQPAYTKNEIENEFLKTRAKDLEQIIEGLKKEVRYLEEKVIQLKKDVPLKNVK